MRMRKLGALEVSELGFGILSFASTYGQAPEKTESIRVIRGAHDLGVTLFDTAEAYGPCTNEALVGEALAPIRNEVVIATKFGFDVDPTTANAAGSTASRSTSSAQRTRCCDASAPTTSIFSTSTGSIRTSPSRT